jgi:DNA-binding response OmpR family regulator
MKSIILVIEENKETLTSVSELLRLEGYDVQVAFTGKSGVEMASHLKPDLILCDVTLSGIDGYGVLHILSQHPVTAKIPFIFLASKINMEDFRKGMNLGADDYLVKPFDCTELLSAIEVRLKKYKYLKNNFDGKDFESQNEDSKQTQPKELSSLFENGLTRHYNKKDYLFTFGEYQHYLHFIIKGEVKISNTNENGKEMIFKLVRDKQFIGHKSLMNGSVYIEDAVALAPTETRLIKTNDFLQSIYCNREIAKWFINSLSYDLIRAEKRLHNLAYQSVRQKVAAVLSEIYEHQELVSKGNPLITLSRKNLAAIVGTALETLNRTVLEFRKEGIVEITPLGIRILQMNKLEQIFHQQIQAT